MIMFNLRSIDDRPQFKPSVHNSLGGAFLPEIVFEIPKSASISYISRAFHLPQNPDAISLGSLNPDLYNNPDEGDISEYPDGHIGRVWFTISHDKESEKLWITVIKVRNLPSRDRHTASICDPFIRIVVLPDERRHQETKIRRKTCNPNYGEHFAFPMSDESLMNRSVRIIVLDVDSLKRHLVIGSLQFPLADYVRCRKEKLTVWRDIKKDQAQENSQLGELHCSLNYNPTVERLTFVVIEAKNLQIRTNDMNNPLVTFAQVSLREGHKQLKVKKTRTVRSNNNPKFNEAFEFHKINANRLDQLCLTVQIMQAKPEKQVGRVMLAGRMFARGKQLSHWNEMVSREKKVVPDWHYLTE